MSRSEVIGCRGHHGRPSILLRFRKPASLVAPVRFSLTIRANALTQPVAHKQLAALQARTLLALVLAFRLWFQFAHASRKRLSKQFYPERVVAYPQRRHSTFRTWPLPPKAPFPAGPPVSELASEWTFSSFLHRRLLGATKSHCGLFPGCPHRSRDTCTRIPEDGRATAMHPWAHGSDGRLSMYEWCGAPST